MEHKHKCKHGTLLPTTLSKNSGDIETPFERLFQFLRIYNLVENI